MTGPSQPEVPKALKAAVIIMGILLVAGFAALVVTIAVRANRLADRGEARPVTAQTDAGQTTNSFATSIDIPRTDKVTEIGAGGGIVLIHLTGESGDKIIVINAETGVKQGVITLVNTP